MPEDASPDSDYEVTLPQAVVGSKLFGRYMLERELGRGGMGVVWLARDTKLEEAVALKFLPDLIGNDRESVAELKEETLRCRKLRHPGIVAVYGFEEENHGAAIVMEYVDGHTMADLKLAQVGRCFEPEQVATWIEQLCEALDYAHREARLVHRDLKPRNLMIDSTGRLRIMDFGLARTVADSLSRVSAKANSSGTPPYMSPQQLGGQPATVADDIYSLGATLYDLLTGKPPFYTGNIPLQVINRLPPSMAERRRALGVTSKQPLPRDWEKLVSACLQKEPNDRPASTREVWSGLRERPQVASGKPASKAQGRSSISKRQRRMLAALSVLFSAIIGGVLLLWFLPSSTFPQSDTVAAVDSKSDNKESATPKAAIISSKETAALAETLGGLYEENKRLRKALGFNDLDTASDRQIEAESSKRELDGAALGAAARQLGADNNALQKALAYSGRVGFRLIPARIIPVATENWETRTINAGSKSGILVEAPVVTEEGLVGKTIAVTPESSTVSLITNHKCGVAVGVEATREAAVVLGTFPGGATPPVLQLEFVSKQANLKRGMNVYTNGMGGVFPTGLLVGQVKEFQAGDLDSRATLIPAVNMAALEYVFVVAKGGK